MADAVDSDEHDEVDDALHEADERPGKCGCPNQRCIAPCTAFATTQRSSALRSDAATVGAGSPHTARKRFGSSLTATATTTVHHPPGATTTTTVSGPTHSRATASSYALPVHPAGAVRPPLGRTPHCFVAFFVLPLIPLFKKS